MTLLYMHFENGENETYKGIKPNPNGYKFDNRFNIKFDKEKKTFFIEDNPNYVQIYNNAISNFSCIVGKNGSGKTTFFELFLSNVVWGMTPNQPSKMLSIYYNINKDNSIEFFLHLYRESGKNHGYKLEFNKENRVFKVKNHRSWNDFYQQNIFTSTIPSSTKFIFHSLSPFDKIFYSIGLKLKGDEFSTHHYSKQMNYIGTQNFIKGEVSHEIQTITSLIRLFTNQYFSVPFEKALGYKFSRLEIDYRDEEEILKEISEEELEIIVGLSKLPVAKIAKINNLAKIIKLIRKLKNKGYLEFKIFLKKENTEINYFYLSSGEKTMISYFVNLSNGITEFKDFKNKTFIILIDEVELHLHPEWQRNFIEYMNKFFRENKQNIKFQFIIATHSPFVLSDIVEEQIIFINQDEKKSNEHNTFGANIYDIFEKGFFLENSIGRCSENYIQELSNTLYLFKAIEHIEKHQDYFLIRNYLQKHYEIDSSSNKSIEEQKKEADEKLYGDVLNELQNKDLSLLKSKVSSTSITKYIVQNNSLKLNEQIEKFINIIGEPTIKMHLKEIYEDIKEFEVNAN